MRTISDRDKDSVVSLTFNSSFSQTVSPLPVATADLQPEMFILPFLQSTPGSNKSDLGDEEHLLLLSPSELTPSQDGMVLTASASSGNYDSSGGDSGAPLFSVGYPSGKRPILLSPKAHHWGRLDGLRRFVVVGGGSSPVPDDNQASDGAGA